MSSLKVGRNTYTYSDPGMGLETVWVTGLFVKVDPVVHHRWFLNLFWSMFYYAQDFSNGSIGSHLTVFTGEWPVRVTFLGTYPTDHNGFEDYDGVMSYALDHRRWVRRRSTGHSSERSYDRRRLADLLKQRASITYPFTWDELGNIAAIQQDPRVTLVNSRFETRDFTRSSAWAARYKQ